MTLVHATRRAGVWEPVEDAPEIEPVHVPHLTYRVYRPGTVQIGRRFHPQVTELYTTRPRENDTVICTNANHTHITEEGATTMSNKTYAADTTSTTDIDRWAMNADEEAAALLQRYVEVGETDAENVTAFLPRHAADLNVLAVEKAKVHPHMNHTDAGDQMLAMQNIVLPVLMNRAKPGADTAVRGGRVVLDTANRYGTLAWQALDVPTIVFCSITSQDVGLKRLSGIDAQGMAVYFSPGQAGSEQVMDKDKLTGAKRPRFDAEGEPVMAPKVFNPDGYIAVVQWFATHQQTKEAADELRQAVDTLKRDLTDSALEPDTVRTAGDGVSYEELMNTL